MNEIELDRVIKSPNDPNFENISIKDVVHQENETSIIPIPPKLPDRDLIPKSTDLKINERKNQKKDFKRASSASIHNNRRPTSATHDWIAGSKQFKIRPKSSSPFRVSSTRSKDENQAINFETLAARKNRTKNETYFDEKSIQRITSISEKYKNIVPIFEESQSDLPLIKTLTTRWRNSRPTSAFNFKNQKCDENVKSQSKYAVSFANSLLSTSSNFHSNTDLKRNELLITDPYRLPSNQNTLESTSKKIKFPLEWFDDIEYEKMTPEQFINIGKEQGLKGTPALTRFFFYPDSDSDWEWAKCLVLDFSSEKNMFLVEWKDSGQKKLVKRLNLLFEAEDHENFYRRIEYAIKMRDYFEKFCEHTHFIMQVEDDLVCQFPENIKHSLLSKLSKFENSRHFKRVLVSLKKI
ncbi:hypothetical protein HK096_003550 [Nowakowskiella sp. JEL0078]|nr:hypothetical protein HK096_003550 [Nowakowskiella sp. JEL0078]